VIGSEATARIVEAMELPGPADDLRKRTFDALVDRRALDRAYRTARLILLDATEAEDATHDAALAAWRRFGELRDPERFEAWFGRILVNACRDRLRTRRRLPVSIDSRVEPLAGAAADPADALARSELLRAALRTLSPEHREVVALRFFADLTVDQIAERTGTRAGTVKSRLHYALRHLRERVEAAGERKGGR
jgi:RNA polymerase sigma-70 factor (ECF subfamily)